MISCDSFRERFHAGTEDGVLLDHLRGCDRCLDFAVGVDSDVLFRSLGGELVPPGGVDAFVDDVMRQVSVRQTENTMRPLNVISWPRRLAIAATLAAGIAAATLVYRMEAPTLSTPLPHAAITAPAATPSSDLATKPVVETYQSETATIFEVPSDETDNVRIVMIFDDALPVDL
jgi:hypothetical protein